MKLYLSKATVTRKEILKLQNCNAVYEKVSETSDDAQIDYLCAIVHRIIKEEDKNDIC